MSIEIKPGQVWAWKDEEFANGDPGHTFQIDSESHTPGHWKYGYVGDSVHIYGKGPHFVASAEVINRAANLVTDATPAPLDPSKALSFEGYKAPITALDPTAVRAGDTVTVEVGRSGEEGEPYSVTGKANVTQNGYMWVGPIRIDPGAIDQYPAAITAHQPAPEPEPEWEPGTSGTATLNHLVSGNSSDAMRVMRVEWDGLHGFATQTGRIVEDDSTTYSVSDFVPDATRPLPTREQVAEAIMTADTTTGNYGLYPDVAKTAADAVLALFGGAR